jgi:formate--tetrahydrofolate ligase
MIVAYDIDDRPVTVNDLKVQGAVAMLLKEAIKPNLVQTLEHNPVLIHGGPFANIAHGCNSVIATDLALKTSKYVVTEAGFGADLGMEKFMDIKTRVLGVMPSAVVLVASIRALKLHGGSLKEDLGVENLEALAKGVANLEKHIENINCFNLPFVVALNRFPSDTEAEIGYLLDWAKANKHPIALSEVFQKGSLGGLDLARIIVRLTNSKTKAEPHPLYPLEMTLNDKDRTNRHEAVWRQRSHLFRKSHKNRSKKRQFQDGARSRYAWRRPLFLCPTIPSCSAGLGISRSRSEKSNHRWVPDSSSP